VTCACVHLPICCDDNSGYRALRHPTGDRVLEGTYRRLAVGCDNGLCGGWQELGGRCLWQLQPRQPDCCHTLLGPWSRRSCTIRKHTLGQGSAGEGEPCGGMLVSWTSCCDGMGCW
jgi:hypothetical protein